MIDLTKLTAEKLYNLVHDFPRSLDSDEAWPEVRRRLEQSDEWRAKYEETFAFYEDLLGEHQVLLERLEQYEAAQAKQRERISACLKGNEFPATAWGKGYCTGVLASLTAFDDAARAALEGK